MRHKVPARDAGLRLRWGEGMRICFIGDSFVNGTGDPECLGWAGRLCAAACRRGHDLTYYNLGVRRETSAEIAARWRLEAAPRLPPEHDTRVVFSFGVNDTAVDGDHPRLLPADSVAHLREVLLTAKAQYPVLMVGPPPVADHEQNRRIASLSHAFAAVCRAQGVPYLPVFASLMASGTWMRQAAAGDGAHPGAQGYAELARLVEGWAVWRAWLP